MSYLSSAQKLRAAINGAGAMLTDEQAATVPGIYPVWSGDGKAYALNDRAQYNGALYKCITAHTSQTAWNPADAPSLWAKVLIPTPSVIPEWEQPSSTNPYAKGDKVRHNGKIWISTVDNNIWEPGAVGTEALWSAIS